MNTVKTTLIAGVGWPEVGEWPRRFKHESKPIRVFKNHREKGRATDAKFEEWLSKPQPIRSKK